MKLDGEDRIGLAFCIAAVIVALIVIWMVWI